MFFSELCTQNSNKGFLATLRLQNVAVNLVVRAYSMWSPPKLKLLYRYMTSFSVWGTTSSHMYFPEVKSFNCKTLDLGGKQPLAFAKKVESVYQKIKDAGGFELLRSGSSNKDLVVITPPPSGDSVPFWCDSSGLGQAVASIRPLQKSSNMVVVKDVFKLRLRAKPGREKTVHSKRIFDRTAKSAILFKTSL